MKLLKPLLYPLLCLFAFLVCCGCTPEPTAPDTTPPTVSADSSILTVDWDMKAYVVWPTGTTTDHFPLQINGTVLEEKSAAYLQLNVDLPDNFRYQPMETAESKGALCLEDSTQSLGVYITASTYYDSVSKETVDCIWAIDTEKGYYIAYWGDEYGRFLVSTADQNCNANDVLRHFRDFIYSHCLQDPAQTIWDIDWQMYGMYISEDGQIMEEIEFSIAGFAVHNPNLSNHSLADLDIRWPEEYRFCSPPSLIGVWVNKNHPEGVYIKGSIVADDLQNKEIVIGYYGLAPEHGFFWLYWETSDTHSRLPGYLVASTDPNTDRAEIEAFFANMMNDERFQ